MITENEQQNIDKIYAILEDEVRGRVQAALDKMDPDYKMVWVYKSPRGSEIFPTEKISKPEQLAEEYAIKGRSYHINHIVANGDVVMAEMTETYKDPNSDQTYSTPMAMVWEFKNGKIMNGRHYCDPNISYLNVPEEKIIKEIYNSQKGKRIE